MCRSGGRSWAASPSRCLRRHEEPGMRINAGLSLPFTVIGGFLGAGKTTLVNALLAQPGGARLAVLVNDFGAVNIDASLIAAREGDTIALSNGCVCCAMGDDLGRGIAALLARRPL